MVSVSEATSIILSHLYVPKKESIALGSATGRFLAESIHSDRDLPPFDRATMDGIAIAFDAFEFGLRAFSVSGTLAAGRPATNVPDTSSCMEIMTGAVMPGGTDTVVRYEDVAIEKGIATIKIENILRGDNIHFRGVDTKKGQRILSTGVRLSPAEIAILASVGRPAVNVFTLPATAIISTGDELVPVDQTPLLHQVRQSNGYALQSSLQELNAPASLFTIRDEKKELEDHMTRILDNHELILISGGVSKGKYDYVPEVLEQLGIKKLFHQVSQKPGKPFWFGKSAHHTVFALPGNPVSTFLCFCRYVKPWLLKSFGIDPVFSTAVLAEDFSFPPPLTYFLQVKIRDEAGIQMAFPNSGGGSGDFTNLRDVDGFLELSKDKTDFKKGAAFPFIPFRR